MSGGKNSKEIVQTPSTVGGVEEPAKENADEDGLFTPSDISEGRFSPSEEPDAKRCRIDPAYSPQSIASDDEETIREEEAMGEAMTKDEELALLQKELDTPLEELLKMYEQAECSPESLSPTPLEALAPPSQSQASPEPSSPTGAPPSPNLSSLYSAARGESDESDEEYKPMSKFRTVINVGPGYQAEVPELCRPGVSDMELERDERVWNPGEDKLTEEQLERYTEEAQKIIGPFKPCCSFTSAVEMALDCLNRNCYNVQAALDELKLNIVKREATIEKNDHDRPCSPGDKEESGSKE